MYELLDHTADVKFRAESKSLGGCFDSAVEAFSEIVTEGESYGSTDQVTVEVESENLEALLFDFLDRLIYVQDVEGVVLTGGAETTVEQIEEEESDSPSGERDIYTLTSEIEVTDIGGKPLLDLKGPTYNDMKVENKNGGWIIVAVIDI
ncbi:MAG: archease [Halobacteria archaeon]